jgi:hypothetical protein
MDAARVNSSYAGHFNCADPINCIYYFQARSLFQHILKGAA